MKRIAAVALLISGVIFPAVFAAEEPDSQQSIKDQMDVGLEYTLTIDGQVVDSTEGKAPFHYVHGRRQIVTGLEQALAGLRVGDTKEVVVQPQEGYGLIDPAAVIEVPKTELPADVAPQAGMVLKGVGPGGQSFQARIKEVKPDHVVLDLNHPLAGKVLNFKVTIQSIALASAG